MADLQEQKGGIPSKQRIYQKAAAYAIEAIETLAKAMREADNDNARVGAAKVLLAKCIPDLKATELTGEGGNEILIKILDYANSNKHYTPAETTVSTTDERE